MNLFKKTSFTIYYYFIIISAVILIGCKGDRNGNFSSPKGYNLSNPVMIHLRNDLDEISGLFYYKKDTSLFAISDENSFLYKIHLKKPIKIEHWKLSIGSDFEDIILHDSTF